MRRTFAAITALVIAALIGSGCTSTPDTNNPQSATVTSAGGTYKLGDITVTVPAGTVAEDTKLTTTIPSVAASDTPFPFQDGRSSAIRFDISLAGNIQPAKPLGVTVPLRGAYLPPGAKSEQALLYTPAASGKGYELVPSVIEKGVLRATLTRLSPKYIAFVAPVTLMLMPQPAPQPRPDCPQTAEGGTTGKVMFGGKSSGWDTSARSPVRPCLIADAQGPRLIIANNAAYMWQVAATNGVELTASSGGTESEVVALIARRVFPDARVKAYLDRDQTAEARLTADTLPATVKLRADPATFLAETAWVAVKFLTSLQTGQSTSHVAAVAKAALETPGMLDCIGAAFKASGANPQPRDIFAAITGSCAEKLAVAVGHQVAPGNLLARNITRLYAITGGVQDGMSLLDTAAQGIALQVSKPVFIEVVREGGPCLSSAELLQLDNLRVSNSPGRVDGSIICENGWALGYIVYQLDGGESDPSHVILHREGSVWVVKRPAGTAPLAPEDYDGLCTRLPAQIKSLECIG